MILLTWQDKTFAKVTQFNQVSSRKEGNYWKISRQKAQTEMESNKGKDNTTFRAKEKKRKRKLLKLFSEQIKLKGILSLVFYQDIIVCPIYLPT